MKKKLMKLSLSLFAVILIGSSAFAAPTGPLTTFPDTTKIGNTAPYDKVKQMERIYMCETNENVSVLSLPIDGAGIVVTPGKGSWSLIYSNVPGAHISYTSGSTVFKVPNEPGTHIFEYYFTAADAICGLGAGDKIWVMIHVLPNTLYTGGSQRMSFCVGTSLQAMPISDVYTLDSIYQQANLTVTWKDASGTTITNLFDPTAYVVKADTDTTIVLKGKITDPAQMGAPTCGSDDIDLSIRITGFDKNQPVGRPIICKDGFAERNVETLFPSRWIGGSATVHPHGFYDKPVVKLAHFLPANKFPVGSTTSDTLYAIYVYDLTNNAGVSCGPKNDTVLLVKDFIKKGIDTAKLCLPSLGTLAYIPLKQILKDYSGLHIDDDLIWTPYGQDLGDVVGKIPAPAHVHGNDEHAFQASPIPSVIRSELSSLNFAYHYKGVSNGTVNNCDVEGWLVVTKANELSNDQGRIATCVNIYENGHNVKLIEGLVNHDNSVTYNWTYGGVVVKNGTLVYDGTGVGTLPTTGHIKLEAGKTYKFDYSTVTTASECGTGTGYVILEMAKATLSPELLSKVVKICITDLQRTYDLAAIMGGSFVGDWSLSSVKVAGTVITPLSPVYDGVLVGSTLKASELFAPGRIDKTLITGTDVAELVFTFTPTGTDNCVKDNDPVTVTIIITSQIV